MSFHSFCLSIAFDFGASCLAGNARQFDICQIILSEESVLLIGVTEVFSSIILLIVHSSSTLIIL